MDEKTKELRPTALEFQAVYEEIMIDEYQDSNQVQEAILKSRKAIISMSMSVDRNDDSVRQDVAALGGTETVVPDLTLIGKISEVSARADSTRQVSYVFSMRLVEAKTGNVVWMNSKTITKQGEKNSVGW